jgi:hypothetical protein
MDLNPIGQPPSRGARWCPACQRWFERLAGCRTLGSRGPICAYALVRPTKCDAPKPNELRPGVVAEFDDPRDRFDPSAVLARTRARLAGVGR